MMRSRRLLLGILLLVIAAIQTGCNSSTPEAETSRSASGLATDTSPRDSAAIAASPAAVSEPRSDEILDPDGNVTDPFTGDMPARVFVFVTTDCPIANRYAPELKRLSDEFSKLDVGLFLVYPNAADTPEKIRQHIIEYEHTATPLVDINHALVRKVEATVTPQAAVFDADNKLVYSGCIDNWYVDFGKNRREATTHELRDAVTAILENRPIPAARVKPVGCYIPELD